MQNSIHQTIPKSPVPKQRKSKPSRAERIKSRLSTTTTTTTNSTSQCNSIKSLTSEDKINEIILQQQATNNKKLSSSLSSSDSSGSSGFSSSRGLNSLEQDNHHQMKNDASQEVDQLYKQLPPAASRDATRSTNNFRLCQCNECRSSGQQIFSRRPLMMMNSAHSEMDLRAAAAGPPTTLPRGNCSGTTARKAVSFRSSVEAIGSPNYRQLNDIDWLYGKTSREPNDSCDSLHVTKDFSLLDTADEDYLRPLDCSTPNRPHQQGQAAGQQLVRVEVHNANPASSSASDYACFCSPNFDCIHNRARNKMIKSNQAASDCIDCKNLSTYVNLSSTSLEPPRNQTSIRQESSALTLPKQMSLTPSVSKFPDASDYLSVARRIQKTIEDCELCKQQQQVQLASGLNGTDQAVILSQSTDNLLRCSCSLRSETQQQQPHLIDLSANSRSSSYHTAHSASTSLLQNSNSLYSNGSRQILQRPELSTGGLSVLPVNGNNNDASGFASADLQANNIDSSLSSLFAYRHISDDNQPTTSNNMNDFDPDSLEISRTHKQLPQKQIYFKTAGQAPTGLLRGSRQQEAPLEHVSLSSNASSAVVASRQQQQQFTTNGNNNRRQHATKVDSVGQSSLARRRLLAQQQQLSNKKKSQIQSSQNNSNHKQQASEGKQSSKTSNGVKGIYKSVKNHLFDRSKSSSSSASTLPPSSSKNQTASSRNLSQSASLPRNLSSNLSASTTALSPCRKPFKSQKVCMSPPL